MRGKLVVGVIAAGLFVVAIRTATDLLHKRLESAFTSVFQRPVEIQAVQLLFPVGVLLTEVAVPSGSGQAQPALSLAHARIHFSLFSFMRGQPGLDVELMGPKLYMERSEQGFGPLHVGGPWSFPRFPLNRLRIRNGEVTFVDWVSSPEVSWAVRDFSVSASSRNGSEYRYGMIGSLQEISHEPIGRLEVNGKFLPGQMAVADLSVELGSLEFLGPSIQKALGVAPARGSCLVKAHLQCRGGTITLDTELTAQGVSFDTDEPTLVGPVGSSLVELLQDEEGQIHLTFVVKSEAGEQPNWSESVEGALQQAIRQALAQSIQRILASPDQSRSFEELILRGIESVGR